MDEEEIQPSKEPSRLSSELANDNSNVLQVMDNLTEFGDENDDSDSPIDDDNEINDENDADGDEDGDTRNGDTADDTSTEAEINVAGACAKTPDEDTVETVNVEKKRFCDACKYDDLLETASGFCITCTEYLCQNCCRDHKKNKLTREHNMLKDGIMPKDVSPFRAIRDLLKCKTHPENEVAYECMDHKQLICVSCLTGSHRKCDDIVDLGTSDKNCLAKAADFSLVTKLLDRLKICTQRNVETADRVKSQRYEIKQECEELMDKWKQHIETLGILLQTEAEAWAKREVKASQERLSQCLNIKKNIDEHWDIVSVLTLHGSRKEVAVVSKTLTEKMNMYKSKIVSIENSIPKQLLLRKTEPCNVLQSLGSVSLQIGDAPIETNVKSPENICNAKGTEANVSEEANATPRELMKRKIDSGKMYEVKTTTDAKTCSIVAIKTVSDGQIVVADQGNEKLKLLSRALDPLTEIKLPGVPSDMCCLGNEVFLCFPELKKIYRYTVGPSVIQEPSSYATKRPPVSLSMFDEERLIILFRTKSTSDESQSDDVAIEVRDGNRINATLEHSEDEDFNTVKEGQWVMRYDESLIILAENEKISCYIVDEVEKWLLFKKRTRVYNSSKKRRLKKPRGLCQDPEGNCVYVCGEESNNVHEVLIRDIGCYSRVIVKGVNKPLCSYVETNRLIVGCQDDFLRVYTFI
ncbi:uncharacterized protein LOC128220762 [Mya arenaria]|uniref:uncharacterized protein LOC128220762 n=1 Tax=Mya arenaria TaxID=6604 RepID=UPI0022E36E88|nr:uncharacterized protein LOC128220762 [Mya arenaria]XP_052785248.1 uncharacterized protein LOC128220762 [Mya arenaria]